MSGLSARDRCLIVLRHAQRPMTTGEIAQGARAASGVVAARMLDLQQLGHVQRVDTAGGGRGFRALWEIVPCSA